MDNHSIKKLAIFTTALSAMLLLAMSGCQSISGFAPYCQSDDDCQSHQFCDTDENACFIKSSYNQECDPSQEYDTCPVATECNADAQACLPRKFRVAWMFSMNSPRYERRQVTNNLKFLTERISAQYFSPLKCATPSTTEQQANIIYRCDNDQIEFLFIDSGDEAVTQQQELSKALRLKPVDMLLTYFSSGYAGAYDLNAQAGLDYLLIGRLNRRADRVKEELQKDYQYPELDERFDFSLGGLRSTITNSAYMSSPLECQRPLVLHEDNQPYTLDRIIMQQESQQFGLCLDYLTIPGDARASYADEVQVITENNYDCIYTGTIITPDKLSTLLQDYRNSTHYNEHPAHWIFQRSFVESTNELESGLRTIISENFLDHVSLKAQQSINVDYNGLQARLEKDYRELLQAQGCLGVPNVSCEDLNCTDSSQADEAALCNQLGCSTTQSALTCLELGCLAPSAPSYCANLECDIPLSQCDYLSPNIFELEPNTITIIAEPIFVAWLLNLQQQHIQKNQDAPLSRAQLRDLFLELANPDHVACKISDITSCTTNIANSKQIHFSGINRDFVLGVDGRLIGSTHTIEFYKPNSNLEFGAPIKSYTPQEQNALSNYQIMPEVSCPEVDAQIAEALME